MSNPLNPKEFNGKAGDLGPRPGVDPYGLRTAVGDMEQYRSEKGQHTVIRQGLAYLSGRVDVIAARIASTANIASLSGLAAIDGVTPGAGDFIMVWQQSIGSQNGIYIAKAGAWLKRYSFFAGLNGSVLPIGALISIYGAGTLYGKTIFTVTGADTVVGCRAYYG